MHFGHHAPSFDSDGGYVLGRKIAWVKIETEY